jgi:Domain of unknown function (DUF309)
VNKHERIGEFVRSRGSAGEYPVCYEQFFALFNAGEYFEAHDVLEYLWRECRDSNAIFYKGLIQIAGGFVHLRRQFLRPEHPKDGKRLRPACRLLALGVSNIVGFGPRHMGLDIKNLCAMCGATARGIEDSGFQNNPWSPQTRPLIGLPFPGSGVLGNH